MVGRRKQRPRRSGKTFNTVMIDKLEKAKTTNPKIFDKKADKLQEELNDSEKIIVKQDSSVLTSVKYTLENNIEQLKEVNASEYARKKFPLERKFGSAKTEYIRFDVQDIEGDYYEEEGPEFSKSVLESNFIPTKTIKTVKMKVGDKTFVAIYYPKRYKL